MRRPALVLASTVVAMALATAADPRSATAQPSPYGAGDERAVPEPAAPSAQPWAQPPAENSQMRAPQQLTHRPSGFWTSNRPARGGAYRWRIMAVGGVVLAITMFFVLRLLIRTSRAGRLPTATAVERR